MNRIEEIRENRIKKLNILRSAGIDPYPGKAKKTHTISESKSSFQNLEKSGEEIFLVGRIMMIREHGKLTFFTIKDDSGTMQALISNDSIGEKAYKFFLQVFDAGDFIQIRGSFFTTKKGEETVKVTDYKMLSKSILPLPEKWHGLKDEDEKLRKRYLDILFNEDIKDIFHKRAIFWNAIRDFLINKGFIEVETPVLETISGGADACPFQTHHNALDIDVYLRISMGELWQKKLMVAGFEKTFEIGRQFRNEGMSPEHLQDYVQMEFYWAYADYKQGMQLVEELYRYVVQKTLGTLKFQYKDYEIDLSKEWERYDYQKTILKETKIDITEANLETIKKTLDKLEINYEKKGLNKSRAVDALWKYCRKKITGPGFLINVPVEVSPLAKRTEPGSDTTARFQIIMGGSEVGNGYSELNDPIEQAERFAEQQKLRDAGDEEAQMYNGDFIEALEHGMPPTCGFGLSERVFAFLMDRPIRECQIFPLMKPKNK